jgi:hypothetical protein
MNFSTAASHSVLQKQKVAGGKPMSPFVSERQRRYFNANRKKLGGKVVDEFNQASKGKDLPEQVKKPHWSSRRKK